MGCELRKFKSFLQIAIAITIFFTLFISFTNCSSSSPNSGGLEPTAIVSAWNAPVGAALNGVTLAEGWQDLREVPAPVNVSGGWTDSVAVTSDGKALLFGYSRADFSIFHDSLNAGAPVFNYTGPVRPGMTGDKFKIFRADLGATSWSVLFQPFNGDPDVNEAAASTNVLQDLVVFTRFDSNGVGDIYFTSKSGGVWSAPTALPPGINTSCKEDNPFVVGSISAGATLYFESNRVDNAATACDTSGHNNHIYYTTYDPSGGGSFSPVQKVNGINGVANGDDDTQVFVTPDKTSVYWTALRVGTAYGVFTADLSGGNYINVRQIVTPNYGSPHIGKVHLIGEANVAEVPEGWLMYMMCGVAQNEVAGQATEIVLKVCRARKPR